MAVAFTPAAPVGGSAYRLPTSPGLSVRRCPPPLSLPLVPSIPLPSRHPSAQLPLRVVQCSLAAPVGGLSGGTRWQSRLARGSFLADASQSVLAFDKVPAVNPYEDDDDDDDDEGIGGGAGCSGGGGGGGRGDGGGGDGGGGPSGPGDLFAWAARVWTYNLARRPILSKALSTAVIGLVGDLIAQVVGHRQALAAVPKGCPYRPPFRFDARRAAAVTALGFAFTGPALHGWYETLGRVFPGGGWAAVVSSVVADQSLFAPVVNGVYLFATGLMEGGAVRDVTAKVRTGLAGVWGKSVAVWLPAQVVNFGFVPLVWRVPYVNCVALMWTVLLSCMAHK
ncbi:hypothetical protein MMPV_005774 [Pyropia vietnamensis]